MEDLGSFFRRYVDAHLKLEEDVLDEFFHFPCLINDLSGVHAIGQSGDLHTYHQSFFEELRNADLAMAKSMVVEQHSSLPGGARAIVSFRFGNSENNLIFDCDYAFALLKQDEKWKRFFAQLDEIRYSDLY
ncbi:hypothetical protein [Thalassospira aquimaris]|uniref:SnoaL-like domain-containing protein n=1 Tax=Thalassospira aquimaris TaxID=3037796 RepID=A0ABT6GCX8_9PROT|nr:hypothetical protein [Thalassospira sp. FZY0004]MDG4719850.1 hypothetical protein [Thalassospira sp. FZY0004]